MSRKLYQLSHVTYSCDYHIVWICKYRGKIMTDIYIKRQLKKIFKTICKWKGWKIQAWHIGDDHIHLYLSIPPKWSISYVMSVLKSKSSSWIKKNTTKFPKGAFWCRGYFVTTAGLDENMVKKYINDQFHHQRDLVQQKVF